VQLLLRPFNPSAVDITIELLEGNDIVYSKTKEDVSLTSNTELKIDWPFLLNNNEKYTVRSKILTHRFPAEPLINTYVADFTAGVVWKELGSGTYDVSIRAVNKDNIALDNNKCGSACSDNRWFERHEHDAYVSL
jgi:hypothetical protein